MMKIKMLYVSFIIGLAACNNIKTSHVTLSGGEVTYEIAADKSKLEAYYKEPHMVEWYTERIQPPPFDYEMDLANKTYMELLFLRNEIYARNGYLFGDAAMRGYFNEFKWYQPVFDIPDFIIQLTEQESRFVEKVRTLENEKLKTKYITNGAAKLVGMDYVTNLLQFKEVTPALRNALAEKNFTLAPAKNDQLFYVYDNNQYQYIPNFITTDLYLQVLHKYLGSLMQKAEEEKLTVAVEEMMEELYTHSAGLLEIEQDNRARSALAYANTYLAIGLTAIKGTEASVDPSMSKLYHDEVNKINNASGFNSDFLNRKIMDYTQFKPRANYTVNDTLRKYFRCIKWLNSAPFNIDDDERFKAALIIAYLVQNNEGCRDNYTKFSSAARLFAGEEDNLSIAHLLAILDKNKVSSVAELIADKTVKDIKKKLQGIDTDRIRPAAGNDLAREVFAEKYILFTAGRYTFDAEIFSRMVHVLRPEPKRTFPKGLDLFAVMGNKTAEDILLTTYHENEKWPAYTDSLSVLKNQFKGFNAWEASIYNKTMESIFALTTVDENYPLFMQVPQWKKKNLNTSLAAWTELKHNMVLYAEEPSAAEAGEGGGPPPPEHISYVEPNIHFWKKSIELLNYQQKNLSTLGLLSEQSLKISDQLKELAEFFLKISEKELKHELIDEKEFNRMTWIGGEIESLTFRILDNYFLPEREKKIALATDVYRYNTTVLEEAVGSADEIYVIAEINGTPVLTKGAVFSYYEFTSDTRLTDEEWKEILSNGKVPEQPEWLKDIYVETPTLESKPGYSF